MLAIFPVSSANRWGYLFQTTEKIQGRIFKSKKNGSVVFMLPFFKNFFLAREE